MEWIGQFVLVLLIKLVSPASLPSSPSVSSTTHKNEELKTNRTYQVTENVIDIPDNTTLPSIVTNFIPVRPLNFGNNTVLTNNNVEQNNNKVEENSSSEESSEENNNDEKLKKNSFSILHIKAEYDDKPVQTQNHHDVLKKVFGGFKDYVYSIKKGVVDGLHSFFHRDDEKPDKESEFHDKFHRNFDDDEDFEHTHDFHDHYHHYHHY